MQARVEMSRLAVRRVARPQRALGGDVTHPIRPVVHISLPGRAHVSLWGVGQPVALACTPSAGRLGRL